MAAIDEKQCPLCREETRSYQKDFDRDVLNVQCDRCGRFKISDEAIKVLQPEQRPFLSAYCRRATGGPGCVTILSTNIEELIHALPKYSPSEKLDNLLALMGVMSPSLGDNTSFNHKRDYPLLIARGEDEINFLTTELQSRGYIAWTTGYKLTLPGWEHLEEIKRKAVDSTRCFVAMWFDESMNPTYENAISPAVIEAGYEPLRIDRHEHVNRIDDEIIGQIKRSRFMVADFTGQRFGVYFEAGMMLGLGRAVIWMISKEELSKDEGLHFDVRQFNFIVYESLQDAKKRLYDRILAVVGEGSTPKAS